MKSKSQIELGAAYWWQPRHGCTPELVEVIEFMPKSISRIKCKNVTPDRPYMCSMTDASNMRHSWVGERPKGSTYGVNPCRGDIYEDVHIVHLTSEKPPVLRSQGIKPKGVRNSSQKTQFDA